MTTIMANDRTIRIRATRWETIEKMAWDFMQKEKKLIKPTDIADALLWKSLKTLTYEEFKEAMKERK